MAGGFYGSSSVAKKITDIYVGDNNAKRIKYICKGEGGTARLIYIGYLGVYVYMKVQTIAMHAGSMGCWIYNGYQINTYFTDSTNLINNIYSDIKIPIRIYEQVVTSYDNNGNVSGTKVKYDKTIYLSKSQQSFSENKLPNLSDLTSYDCQAITFGNENRITITNAFFEINGERYTVTTNMTTYLPRVDSSTASKEKSASKNVNV